MSALFVSARRRVLARLSTVDARATALGDQFIYNADAGSDPLGRGLAERARTTTIDRIIPLLDGIDIAKAAILLRGPAPAVAAAYAALGRRPAPLD
jgi:hypothetical protein